MLIGKILKQILKEFWFPLLIAVLWVCFNLDPKNNTGPMIIGSFASAFFFTSWLSGQYFRVSKQTKVDGSLKSIQARIESLLQELELKTKDIVAHLTGGDSFCYMLPVGAAQGSNTIMTSIQHQGGHSLFNVQARVVDLETLRTIKGPLTFENLGKSQVQLTYGTLIAGFCLIKGQLYLGENEYRDFNIFWITNNGSFEQQLRFRKLNNIWYFSTQVTRDGELLFEKVQEGFPVEGATLA